jgi:hypothetical protein
VPLVRPAVPHAGRTEALAVAVGHVGQLGHVGHGRHLALDKRGHPLLGGRQDPVGLLLGEVAVRDGLVEPLPLGGHDGVDHVGDLDALLLGELGDGAAVLEGGTHVVLLDAEGLGDVGQVVGQEAVPGPVALGPGVGERVLDGVGLVLGDGAVVDEAVERVLHPAGAVAVVVGHAGQVGGARQPRPAEGRAHQATDGDGRPHRGGDDRLPHGAPSCGPWRATSVGAASARSLGGPWGEPGSSPRAGAGDRAGRPTPGGRRTRRTGPPPGCGT